jgi:hypothetical protein
MSVGSARARGPSPAASASSRCARRASSATDAPSAASRLELYPDWEVVADETVAYLLLATGVDPDDPEMAALIACLGPSDVFAQLWTRHDVREKTHGSKRFQHPLVGALTLEYETLTLPDPGQVLVTYTAEPGSPSAAALDLLGSLAYSEAASSTK